MKSIFYDYSKILSYNAMLNFIVAERGVGKTYGAKLYCLKKFLKSGSEFVYIRRYRKELKEAIGVKANPLFWKQIADEDVAIGHDLHNDNRYFYVDKVIAGYAIPLSTANIMKSTTFDKVETIIFDEFALLPGNYHYLQNEVTQFLELIESIGRLRNNIRIFLLGNALSITNPYFNYYKISLPYNSDFATFKDGLIVLNFAKNLKYREKKKESRFGQLIDNTHYGDYAINNEFLIDSKAFIAKKTPNARNVFNLVVEGETLGVWKDSEEGKLFISAKYDPKCLNRIALTRDSHNETTIYGRRSSPASGLLKVVLYAFEMARLFFETQAIKNKCLDPLLKECRF